MVRSRKSSGSIFVLVVLVMFIITGVSLVGFSFNSLLFKRTTAQHKVDALAISLASAINAGDRVGQINDLEARARELVYVSRQLVTDCNAQELRLLTPVCDQLLEESRAGQRLVEGERRNLMQVITTEIQDTCQRHNSDNANIAAVSLAWLQAREPMIVRVDAGRLANTESNVKGVSLLRELAEFDSRQNYLQPMTGLFKAETNAKLPGPDGDLDFKISALPAFVIDTSSPTRNTNPEVFIRSNTLFDNGIIRSSSLDQIPNAIQVNCAMDTVIGDKRNFQAQLYVTSTATTNGAVMSSDQR